MSISSDIERTTKNLRLNGIVSMDVSSPSPTNNEDHYALLLYGLAGIVPNLLDVDLSNTNFKGGGYWLLNNFVEKCPKLKKITWHNMNSSNKISLSGFNMNSANNLKEIMMDDSVFYCNSNAIERMSDIVNHPNDYMFHYCCKVIERVSIRGAKYSGWDNVVICSAPQNALIKFVRNSPLTLKWFRSDLTQDNITILKSTAGY